jgi:hypothetical protein
MKGKKMPEAKLNPILYNLRQSVEEEYKRSNHPDFLTTSELKVREWSGVRKNSITDDYEFWVAGEIIKTVSLAAVKKDPFLLERTHIELFKIGSGSHSR